MCRLLDNVEPRECLSFRDKTYRLITILALFVTPVKIANTFVNLSILLLIYKVASQQPNFNEEIKSRIANYILRYIGNNNLMLPIYTIYWFWEKSFLNEPIVIQSKTYKLIDVIKDCDLLINNIKDVTEMFIDHLPTLLQIKLGTDRVRSRVVLKNNIQHAVLTSH